ncbi:MAG: NADH-quinone oxidoreductase subunit J [Bacteroidota bacterium]
MTLNFFYFLSFLAILAAVMVVVSRNPIHSVLYLIVTFFCIAGHYVLLNAQFLAVVHIIVYAGAIMVLFLYVIMLLNLNRESEPHKSTILKIMATVCGGLLMIVIIGSLKGTEQLVEARVATGEISLVKNLGKVMFSDFLIPFEVTSVLLLAAMVGAVMLGKSEHTDVK